jgi:hypothetical protein
MEQHDFLRKVDEAIRIGSNVVITFAEGKAQIFHHVSAGRVFVNP